MIVDTRGLSFVDDGSSVTVDGFAPIVYDGFETVNIVGRPPENVLELLS